MLKHWIPNFKEVELCLMKSVIYEDDTCAMKNLPEPKMKISTTIVLESNN